MKILVLAICCFLISLAQWSPSVRAEELTAQSRPEARAERICFSATSTREQAIAHKLVQPYQIIKRESVQRQAEAIGARLCRWKEQLVYEINLLQQDGRVVHIYFNATNGTEIANAR